jgi:hypothetical protein
MASLCLTPSGPHFGPLRFDVIWFPKEAKAKQRGRAPLDTTMGRLTAARAEVNRRGGGGGEAAVRDGAKATGDGFGLGA